jgi:membrane protein
MYKVAGQALKEWNKDNAYQMGAAIAFFGIFSVAPLLIIAVSIAGFIFGENETRISVFTEIQALIGEESAIYLQNIVENSFQASNNWVAVLIGVGSLIFGAVGVFIQLKNAVRRIWASETVKHKKNWKVLVKEVLLPFLLVIFSGFLLIAMFLTRAILNLIAEQIELILPFTLELIFIFNYLFSLGLTIIVLMFLYKFLPVISVSWKSAFFGALFASLLIELAKLAIDFYINWIQVNYIYGAAGSLVVIMLWGFVVSLIFLYGAEITKVINRQN